VRYTFLLVTLLTATVAFGQKVSGVVVDKITKQPIAGALVSVEQNHTRTNQAGRFEIGIPHSTDSLKITSLGYKTILLAAGKLDVFVTIELELNINNLNEVTIYGDKSFKKDSLANRANFKKQFDYKGPRVIDAFTNGGYVPGQLISINVLLLVEALTKKSTPEYKFNQVLKRDEHEQYVDEHFNRGNVSRVTSMHGDTLLSFLVKYRPTYEFVLKSTDYDMEVYIKGCYKKFADAGFKTDGTFAVSN
jgi:hypothetical protein